MDYPAQALEAYRVLRAGACLHTHAEKFTLAPAHISSLSLAAQDLIAAFSGHTLQAASEQGPPPPHPLSPCAPLAHYLAALPTAPLPLPALPPRPTPKDASLSQVIKDVERDTYLVSSSSTNSTSTLLHGATARFSGVLQACLAAAAEAAAAAAGGAATSARLQAAPLALEDAVARALQQGSRTTSGGDAYEALHAHLGLSLQQQHPHHHHHHQHAPLPLLLTADSSSSSGPKATPVALTFSPATLHHAAAEPAAALHALRTLLQACPALLPRDSTGAPAGAPAAPATQAALEAAAAWACGLEAGLHIDVSAATSYLLVLEGGAQAGDAGGAAEPRVVARLQAVYRQRLCYAAASALLLPGAPATITLCREQ